MRECTRCAPPSGKRRFSGPMRNEKNLRLAPFEKAGEAFRFCSLAASERIRFPLRSGEPHGVFPCSSRFFSPRKKLRALSSSPVSGRPLAMPPTRRRGPKVS